MAKQFDLRKQLKLHDNGLLRQLFADQEEMASVDWDLLKAYDVEPIVEAWETMDESRRRHFQVILQDIHELADEPGQKVLLEEIGWRCPEKLATFNSLRSLDDKSLWTYLEVHKAFDEAAIFARAEALRGGSFAKRWNSLPTGPFQVNDTLITALQDEIRQFYWKKEMRGEVCRVHHYRRPGDAEFFFAYLPDWPDKRLVIDANGNLTPREESYAFTNVFIYLPSEGALEMIAKGGKNVHYPLRKAFCLAVLGIKVDDAEPERPTYKLDHLLTPGFVFRTEPEDHISAVRIRRIRLVPSVKVPAIEHIEPKFKEYASHSEVMAAIDEQISACKLDNGGSLHRSQVTVTQVGIQLQFMSDGHHKGKTMTFNISCPDTCDLKSKPDDVRVISDRCVKRWGFLDE